MLLPLGANALSQTQSEQAVQLTTCPSLQFDTVTEIHFPAKAWNGPGWDKVGIEFTGSQPYPNFLLSHQYLFTLRLFKKL